MSLAARCPSCGTVFRVVQDQLRVSEGWVRCGRCGDVFNAIENLVDLEADVAAPPPASSPGRERVMDDLARVSGYHDDEPERFTEPGEQRAERHALDSKLDSLAEAELARDAVPASEPAEPSVDATPGAEDPAAEIVVEPDLRDAVLSAPSFVRRAERAERWRRPGVRASLWSIVLLGSMAIVLQAALAYRNPLAARWPQARPWLEQACIAAACSIEAARGIDSLAVESSGLARIENTSMYRLSVVLRNRATWALAVPSIDLTLTDSQGAVIARRVIGPAELGVQQTSLPARAELPLHVTLGANERVISGYTIEIFYP